jgi:hypothetical protein
MLVSRANMARAGEQAVLAHLRACKTLRLRAIAEANRHLPPEPPSPNINPPSQPSQPSHPSTSASPEKFSATSGEKNGHGGANQPPKWADDTLSAASSADGNASAGIHVSTESADSTLARSPDAPRHESNREADVVPESENGTLAPRDLENGTLAPIDMEKGALAAREMGPSQPSHGGDRERSVQMQMQRRAGSDMRLVVDRKLRFKAKGGGARRRRTVSEISPAESKDGNKAPPLQPFEVRRLETCASLGARPRAAQGPRPFAQLSQLALPPDARGAFSVTEPETGVAPPSPSSAFTVSVHTAAPWCPSQASTESACLDRLTGNGYGNQEDITTRILRAASPADQEIFGDLSAPVGRDLKLSTWLVASISPAPAESPSSSTQASTPAAGRGSPLALIGPPRLPRPAAGIRLPPRNPSGQFPTSHPDARNPSGHTGAAGGMAGHARLDIEGKLVGPPRLAPGPGVLSRKRSQGAAAGGPVWNATKSGNRASELPRPIVLPAILTRTTRTRHAHAGARHTGHSRHHSPFPPAHAPLIDAH